MPKYPARIIINEQANDGEFEKDFLLKLLKMGALITVHTSQKTLYLEEKKDFEYFKKIKK